MHIDTFWDGRQALFGVITDFRMGSLWLMGAIYVGNRGLQRRVLWRQLSLAQEYGIPICWIGDFNIIRKEEEKKGGAAVKFHRDVREFSNYINNNALIDLKFKGPQFTWSNGGPGRGTIFKRLDRCLVSESWLNLFPNALLENLTWSCPLPIIAPCCCICITPKAAFIQI